MIFSKNVYGKNSFLRHIDKVDISKDSYRNKGTFKYFIGYRNKYVKPLWIRLPQMNGYFKHFDSKNKYMNLLVHDKELLKIQCRWILDKISNLLKKEVDSELVHDYKYIKSKINFYNGKIKTNFHVNKIPRNGECCALLSVILLDSVIEVEKKSYTQIFLEGYKYGVKKKSIRNTINEQQNLDDSEHESDKQSNKEDKDCILMIFKFLWI